MKDIDCERITALRLHDVALKPYVAKQFHLSAVLNHFLSSRAQLYGISEAEFVRRLLMEALEKWQHAGLYQIPEVFLSAAQGKIVAGTPSRLRVVRGKPPTVPYSPVA